MPNYAETCGPWVTEERVNIAVQHPGEGGGGSFANQSSHWPDGGNSIPRPSIVSVWPNGKSAGAKPGEGKGQGKGADKGQGKGQGKGKN